MQAPILVMVREDDPNQFHRYIEEVNSEGYYDERRSTDCLEIGL
jgi:hypothetical protein